MEILLIILAIIPGLAICWYIFKLDKYESEPRLPLIICFALGMAVTYPTMILEEAAIDWGWDSNKSLWGVLLYSFAGIAIIEELIKTLTVFAYPWHRPFFNEPLDGIVYSVMIGMGFATLENIIYATTFGLETALVRAFTAVPAHAVFAILTGYYIGLAKFDSKKRFQYILTGLGLAILSHGIYDFFLLQELYSWLAGFAIVTLYVSFRFAKKMVKLHMENSPFKEPELEAEVASNENEISTTTNWDQEINDLLDSQEKEGL